ncbi:beta-ketoacyl synthase [Mycena olivaceomarginata]|nr:beta-ketoacyl synthase [Mycena olivaceomarginata]
MSETIAIVGISCELPGGPDSTLNLDHDGFFEFLLNYGEAYEKIPSNRFNIESWSGSGPGQISVDTGAFLKDIDLFDNFEFGLSTKDTKAMAATTRKLIEHSFLALLDSGIDYRNKNIGCYMSASLGDLMTVAEPDEFDAVGSFTSYPALVANQVSYTLDLLGPSLPTDTACSSTATATHLAVQALRSGDCDAAVVGGCQLNHRFMDWINYSQGSLLAPDGKCKPFDASADGFARAEGCVVFILKPLEKALRDNDLIYGTV